MTLLEAALAYAKAGKRVFPCIAGGKAPLTTNGFRDASDDPAQIEAWWSRWPNANIGMPTDEGNGTFILDVDTKSGGDAEFEALTVEHGGVATRSVRTPSGGMHYYFHWPLDGVKRRIGVRPGIDFMGTGGYVLVPPSRTATGAYTVEDSSPLSNPPDWLLELAQHGAKQEVLRVPAGRVIPEGQRDTSLYRFACYYRANGDSEQQILDKLVEINVNECRPPLDHRDLERIARSASRHPAGWRELAPSPETFHTTDMGNARRLVVGFGSDLRYLHDQCAWLVWDGRRWARDEGQHVVPFAKQAVLSIYREASDAADEAVRQRLGKHAAASESNQKLQSAIALARSEPEIAARSDEFDLARDLLNCMSGTINLAANRVSEHSRADYLTHLAPVNYDPEATCPTWLAFLERVMDGNQRLIEYLRRAAGYSLTGHTREQCLFMLYGSGANGKSTFLETLCDVWGEYAMRTQFSTWLASDRGEPSNEIARLAGVRMVVSNEAEGGARMAESLVKQVTGGDRIRARFLYHESFEFLPAFKLWVAVNHKPTIRGTDEGIWRRIRLIPFEVVIPPEERDSRLRDHLRMELQGIFAWAVRGAFEWFAAGLMDPPEVVAATLSYRESQDAIREWIDECLTKVARETVTAADLYRSYKNWAELNGMRARSSKDLGIIMAERGFQSRKTTGGRRVYEDVALNSGASGASDPLPKTFF